MLAVSGDGGLDDAELQLGLWLAIGGCGPRTKALVETQSIVSSSLSSSSSARSSASSSSLGRADDAPLPLLGASSDTAGLNLIVGWPPVRAHRISSMGNRANLVSKPQLDMIFGTSKMGTPLINNLEKTSGNKGSAAEKEYGSISLFVKVNMERYPIGRKVDLSSYNCYETLSQALEGMFANIHPSTCLSIGPNRAMKMTTDTMHPASKLLIGSSEYVLTYEDMEGDWMLVGDVPWRIFCDSVKRLRITRTSDTNGPPP